MSRLAQLYRLTPEMLDVGALRPLTVLGCRPDEVLVIVSDPSLAEADADNDEDRYLLAKTVNWELGCHLLCLNDEQDPIFAGGAGMLVTDPQAAVTKLIYAIERSLEALEPIKHLVMLPSLNEFTLYGDYIQRKVLEEVGLPVSFPLTEECQGGIYFNPIRYLLTKTSEQITTSTDTSRLLRGVQWPHPRLILLSAKTYAETIITLWCKAQRH